MSPRLLTTVRRRFRISDDILVLILEYLDPMDLVKACKAHRRIYDLTKDYQSLSYKFTLAQSGMNDGPVPHSRVPPYARLQLLAEYHRDWPSLRWSNERQLILQPPVLVGVTGGFLHQIRKTLNGPSSLDLLELPSCRTNRPPANTRQLSFQLAAIDSVAIDLPQNLLVTSHIFNHDGQVCVELSFRDVGSFKKHKRAAAASYEFSTQVSVRMAKIAIFVCGSKAAVSMEFAGGAIKHLIVNWKTFEARWLDDHDIHFLDENALLAVSKTSKGPILTLYHISHVSKIVALHTYELPEIWSRSSVSFNHNTSETSPDALFCSAPENRVISLTARSRQPGHHPYTWLFVKESFFRYSVSHYSSKVAIPWAKWDAFTILKDMAGGIKGPYVVGARAIYLEVLPGKTPRMKLIDFPAMPDANIAAAAVQTLSWAGKKAGLIPVEKSMRIPEDFSKGTTVEDIRMTEDNIVVFLNAPNQARKVNVLTFGNPLTLSRR